MTSQLTDDELLDQSEKDARRMAAKQVAFTLTLPECFILLSQIQLALRHPGNTGSSAQIARRLARQLERMIALTPALAELFRRGWDPAHDVEAH